MPIDKAAATRIAVDYLNEKRMDSPGPFHDELTILEEYTEENNFGWLFYYDTKLYKETNNPIYGLAGNFPIIVTRDGQVHTPDGALPLDVYLRNFRENRI